MAFSKYNSNHVLGDYGLWTNAVYDSHIRDQREELEILL